MFEEDWLEIIEAGETAGQKEPGQYKGLLVLGRANPDTDHSGLDAHFGQYSA
jgi:hypothetical protein